MVLPEHGEAYAEAIPGGQFRLITNAGHLPQLETPAELLAVVREFANSYSQTPHRIVSASLNSGSS